MPRTQSKKTTHHKKKSKPTALQRVLLFWRLGSLWRRIWIVLTVLAIIWTGACYGVAQWYIASRADEPYRYGITFIPDYARSFGLDPKETFQAMITDLDVKQYRLVSYWNRGEPEQGKYDFSELDWQFQMAEEAGAKVSLAIGLRQPRWPECHMPKWAEGQPMNVWSIQLKQYMKRVIERYKDSPALESYQLENEFFMEVFGICPDFTRERLVDEFNFVKQLDPSHPVIISRSNNWIGLPLNEPTPDEFGISVYKRVWDKTFTHRYFEYPLPAWFYAMLAGGGKIFTGKDMIIHELQAEPWLPDGYAINSLDTLKEQDKSMNAKRLAGRFDYARGMGMHDIYLWGAEWWYWRKVKANDPTLWDTARLKFHEVDQKNKQLTQP